MGFVELIVAKFNFWLSCEFFAVGVFAFLGVAIRVGIENAFLNMSAVGDPSSGFGPFMQMFYTQNFLIPNFLGCFIMAVAIVNTARISKISVPLYKGISTGLCGSITTFSSWINGSVCCLLGDRGSSSWIDIFIMIMLQIWMTWSAFTLGYAVTKINFEDSLLYNYFFGPPQDSDGGKSTAVQENVDSSLVANEDGAQATSVGFAESAGVASLNKRMSTSGRLSIGGRKSATGRKSEVEADDDDVTFHALSSRISVWREDGTPQVDANGRLSSYGLSGGPNRPKSILRKSEGDTLRQSELSIIVEDEHRSTASSSSRTMSHTTRQNTMANAGADGSARAVATPSVAAESVGISDCVLETFQDHEYAIWVVLFSISAGLAWVLTICCTEIAFYQNSDLRVSFLRSVALAPFGAWFRWGVTKFPGK